MTKKSDVFIYSIFRRMTMVQLYVFVIRRIFVRGEAISPSVNVNYLRKWSVSKSRYGRGAHVNL